MTEEGMKVIAQLEAYFEAMDKRIDKLEDAINVLQRYEIDRLSEQHQKEKGPEE